MKKARMKRKNDNKLKGKPGGEFEEAVESGISEAMSMKEVLNNSPERLMDSKISELIKMDQGEFDGDPQRAVFNNKFSDILDDIEKQAPDTAFTLRERLRDEYNGVDNYIDPRTGNELSDSPGWRDDFSEDTPRPFPQGMEDKKITKKIRKTIKKANREQSDSKEMGGEEFDSLFEMVTGNSFDPNSSMDQGKMEVLKKAKSENPNLSDSQLALKIYKDYM